MGKPGRAAALAIALATSPACILADFPELAPDRADAGPAALTGAVRWQVVFDTHVGPDPRYFGDVAVHPDGGAVAVTTFAGSSGLTGPGAAGEDVVVVRIGADGAVVWSRAYGAAGDEIARAVAVDGAGAIYVAGTTTSDPMIFGGAPNPLRALMPFVVKLNSSGELVWATPFDVTGTKFAALHAIRPSATALVVGGNFAGTLGFDAADGTRTTRKSVDGTTDALVLWLDPATGRVMRDVPVGGKGADDLEDLAVAGDGAVFVAGKFDSDALAPFDVPRIGPGENAFLGKLEADGSVAWSRSYGQSSGGAIRGLALSAGKGGDVALGGDFEGTLPFGEGITVSTRSAFVGLFEPDGAERALAVSRGVRASVRGLAHDASGNVVAVGELSGQLTPTFGGVDIDSSFSDTSSFVVKLDRGGEVLWAHGLLAVGGAALARRVVLDASGASTIIGNGSGDLALWGAPLVPLSADGSALVLALDP